MAGGISVSVTLSPQWRDAEGRFARSPVAGAAGSGLQHLGRDALPRLMSATPVRTGYMQQSWRQTYLPSAMQLRITNLAAYWAYVVWGTSRQAANPALQAVLHEDLPAMARVTADEIGKQILLGLKG